MGYAHGDSSEVSLCALAWLGTTAVGACTDRAEPGLTISVSFVAFIANALTDNGLVLTSRLAFTHPAHLDVKLAFAANWIGV